MAPDSMKIVSEDLQKQREYIERVKAAQFDFDLVVSDAFVRGIRDIGYKSTATALDELIDNSIQAGAQNVHVVFGYEGGGRSKPSALAVIDDGHGMDPEMIRLAVMWGGSHRENDRTGFGRYGYGLPSSCVSQGRRFSVISAVEGEPFYQVTLDVDDMSAGMYIDPETRRMVVPDVDEVYLPEWIEGYIRDNYEQFSWENGIHGTVVVIEKLDRLSWKTTANLQRNLLEQFGITYRNYLRNINIVVNGQEVQCVDPLFLSPGCRHYNSKDPAEALEPLNIVVKDSDTRKELGVIKVRFAYMPPTWMGASDDESKARFNVLKAQHGMLVLRNGRQIDTVTRFPDTWNLTLVNYDRYWKVEVDFPPTLDEEFSITTSKQQIVLSERMWEILKQEGVRDAMREMKSRFQAELMKLKTEKDTDETEKRTSEEVMERAEPFSTPRPAMDTVEQEKRSREQFQEEVERRARDTGQPPQVIERELEAQAEGRPYKVRLESLPGAPFFRVVQIGGQKVLYLNSAHRFVKEVYMAPEASPRLRASLELLLWTLGIAELQSTADRQRFYEGERAFWSQRLNVLLSLLNDRGRIEDELEALLDADENGTA